MNEFESYVIPINEIPTTSKLLTKIRLRPTKSLLFMGVIAILLMIPDVWSLRVFAGVILLLVIFQFIRGQNTKVMDIYEDFIVVYNNGYPDECQLISWDNIEEWFYETGGMGANALTLLLDTGEYVFIYVYTPGGFMSIFNSKIYDKESRQKRLKEAGESNTPIKSSLKVLWNKINNKRD